ncbi:DUF6882 domain-containing protein [Brevibacterium sp. HMSC24B04]|uniref:DUF6882 domain-containing protein n=1 Tax=Brevibacterium sp. HMSC24B04 TaxID=1581060 RepID=UPI0008A6602F|nr:DUF6882 domain-containing protein [Brevibacterium sp. HMSC24B04]OFT93047.1 hypothetical protein HMPREF3092_06425 [Brevibacterium sp. HMSC24B04]
MSELTTLLQQAAFGSIEAQRTFEALLAQTNGEWEVDLQRGHIVFGDQLHADVHLLGSTDTVSGTWRWAWSELSDFSGPVVELAKAVRDYGQREGINNLTLDEFKAGDDDALSLVIAAKRITGHWVHYPLKTGTMTVWTLLDVQGFSDIEPTIRSVVKALAAGVKSGGITDHRRALLDYAALRGFATAPLEGSSLRILLADGSADTDFDEQSRLTNCQVHAPLEGEAQEQFAAAQPVTAQSVPIEVDFSVAAQPAEEPSTEKPAPALGEHYTGAGEVDEPTPERPAAEKPAAAAEETEKAPVVEQPEAPREPAEDKPAAQQQAPEQTPVEEQPKKKKKGFFGKLFGR